MVIETALAEGDHLRVASEAFQFIARGVGGCFHFSGMNTDGRENVGVLIGEGEGGPAGGKVGADGDEAGHASIRRALDDGLAVGIEVGEIEVAMGVDEQRDEDKVSGPKGKGKLEKKRS